jgi:hypothetical protein
VSTYAQTNSIRESLDRIRPDDHSCLMIYETPKDQLDQQQIEEFDRQVKNYVDVAVYNRKQVPPQVLLNLIRSHPVVIWDGTVCANLHAAVPGERLTRDPTTHDVERMLANLRDRQRIEDGLREQCRNAAVLPVESLLSGAPADSSPGECAACLPEISTLQEQILHSERMEALGRMATGMANEFDNRLDTIPMSTEPMLDRLEPDDSLLNLAKRAAISPVYAGAAPTSPR